MSSGLDYFLSFRKMTFLALYRDLFIDSKVGKKYTHNRPILLAIENNRLLYIIC